MAQIILTAAGNAVAGPVGGFLAGMAGSFIDNALFGSTTRLPDQIGPRLDNLKVQTSAYGEFIPQLFGYFRLGGNVIWSRDIKEVETRETVSSGGKGGGSSVSQTNVSYSYSITLAIAICEGEIDDVLGVWADSKKLSASTINAAFGRYEVHLGSETQAPSAIIESYEGLGNTPAYRGVAYVVIEDFPLAEYGNRIPNFTFEVRRRVQPSPSVEDLVKDITLIPGSGESVYATQIMEKYTTVNDAFGIPRQSGKRVPVNMHNFDGKANVLCALDQMQKTFPNLEWVSVVVNWFITSKDMASAQIVPKIEFADHRLEPHGWSVGTFHRDNASEVLRFPDQSLTYGGTPSDRSIIELCEELKARGLRVMLYPMPLVDTVDEIPGEDDKPWRGRIVPSSASECDDWFTRTQGYNAFIRHYAQLTVNGTALRDLIDAFVIGTEMRGITTFDAGGNTYPGVENLRALAALVRADMADASTPVLLTYAADWSEYHSVGGYYHLDALWSSPDIDVVGMDNYMPLTPDIEQSVITQEAIKRYWEDGEGWAYFYADSVARTGRTDYTPNDGTSPFAWKNIEQFWNSEHFHYGDPAQPTGWTGKMKPIWFAEFGFPSVDGAANQPNVFVDPTSIESFYPRGSKGRVDILAQRNAVNATLEHWQEKNAQSGNSDLVPRMFLWTWDARPYPFWPDLLGVWADGSNWHTGHWVNGKFGSSSLGAIIATLLQQVGYSADEYDVSELDEQVEGFVINHRTTLREHLELLRSLYFFDVVESDGVMRFQARGRTPSATIKEADLVPQERGDLRITTTITRKQELELPQQVDVTFVHRPSGFQASTQTALRQQGDAIDKAGISAPIVMSDATGKRIAEQSLYVAWVSRHAFEFTLPPRYVTINGGDVITLNTHTASHEVRVVSTTIARSGVQKVRAVSEDISAYDVYVNPGEAPTNPARGTRIADTHLELLDLPRLPSDSDDAPRLHIAATGMSENWRGAVIYRSVDGGESGGNSFSPIASVTSSAIIGTVLSPIEAGPRNVWDNDTVIDVVLLGGELQSVTKLALLSGANACLCGEEIIQFQYAELIAKYHYRLSRLLRGRQGTQHHMHTHSVGERFVLLDSAVLDTQIAIGHIGLIRHYKPVSVGATLAGTQEQPFRYAGNQFRPYSPVHIQGQRDENANLTITWTRRTRVDGGWRDHVDVALGEESETYEIDIMNGTQVVRTLHSDQPTITYSATQQIEDFSIPQNNLAVTIYQISAVIGRGTAGEALI